MRKLDLTRKPGDDHCHNWGAPFESTVLDEEANYKDGYESGLKWAQAGQFYQAGGPYITGEYATEHKKGCCHWRQHVKFQELNNKAWRRGWADGQGAAFEWRPA